MQIPVLVEPVSGTGFRAQSAALALSAEGPTRSEALEKLRELIHHRLNGGAEITYVEVPGSEHPLAKFAGMFKDDPLFDDWQQAIAEYRQKVDEDPHAI